MLKRRRLTPAEQPLLNRPDHRRRNHVRRRRTAALLAAAVGCTLLFGLEAVAERGGHSLDPTDPMNYNTYALRNDSSATLYVHLCADPACGRLADHSDWITVRPGSAADEQVYWGSEELTAYAVTGIADGRGARRCLLLRAVSKASATVEAPLTSATRCSR